MNAWIFFLSGAVLALVALAWLGIAFRLWQAQMRTPTLEPPGPLSESHRLAETPWPRLSVIVAARDEAGSVERALRSLLQQDYPALEVIAVDDRSTDGTGAILEGLAANPVSAGRLTVLHVERLPPGWLGKTHALHVGQERAGGELLLFTDADVVYAPGALRAAVTFLEAHGLGHLAAGPRVETHGYWERAFQATFALYFALRCRLWALRRARSRAYVGIGAFNLVRRADYARVGGHARLALEVVDDLKLGLLLRHGGVPQGLAAARELLSVRWQPGFWASLQGLLKNAFADQEYRWSRTLCSVAALLVLGVLPWAGLGAWCLAWALGAAPAGWAAAMALAGIIVPALLVGAAAYTTLGGSGLEGFAAPLTHAALAAVLLTSAALATARRGLAWRGTRYPLSLLRGHTLREGDLPPGRAVGW